MEKEIIKKFREKFLTPDTLIAKDEELTAIEDFILEALSQQKLKIKKVVEGLRIGKECPDNPPCQNCIEQGLPAYNQALTDIIKEIEK